MVDSDAVRSRRKRAHAAGDHSQCRRCEGRGAVAVPAAAGDAGIDPRGSLESLALRLEAAHEADPGNAAVARELRVTLLALRGPDETADSELAGMFAEFGRA